MLKMMIICSDLIIPKIFFNGLYFLLVILFIIFCKGQYSDWLVGVRVIKNKKLVGFISGIPVNLNVNIFNLNIRLNKVKNKLL